MSIEAEASSVSDNKNQAGIIYKTKDFVYVEESPTLPYKIGQILSFKSGPTSTVYVKLRYFERRRELDNSSLKKLQAIEEKLIFDRNYSERNFPSSTTKEERLRINHQFKLRSLIPHKNGANDTDDGFVNASFIRGKVMIVRFVDVETAHDYIDHEDLFYYVACIEDQDNDLVVEGEFSLVLKSEQLERAHDVKDYKPLKTDKRHEYEKICRDMVIWDGRKCNLSDTEFDVYFSIVRSVGLYGRALDQTRRVNDSSIQSNLAYAFRDSTKYLAYNLLHNSDYNWQIAATKLFVDDSPIICTDQLEMWSEEDILYFYDEIKKVKRFNDIAKAFKNCTWKSVKEMIEFYYMHKVTEVYMNHKKERISKKSNIISQIFIPQSALPMNYLIALPKTSITENICCEGCCSKSSITWYPWLSNNSKNYNLCSSCWTYWKKYGGLPTPHIDDGLKIIENPYICNICRIPFVQKRRFDRHLSTHYSHKCPEKGCNKKFSTAETLKLHKTYIHENFNKIPSCQNLTNRIFLYSSTRKWKKLRVGYASYAVNTKVIGRKYTCPFERVIFNNEGRITPVLRSTKRKRVGDLSHSFRKRSNSKGDSVNATNVIEPPSKIMATA